MLRQLKIEAVDPANDSELVMSALFTVVDSSIVYRLNVEQKSFENLHVLSFRFQNTTLKRSDTNLMH